MDQTPAQPATADETPVSPRADFWSAWVWIALGLAILDYTPPPEFEALALPLELLASDDDFKTRVAAGTYVRLLCYPAQFEANGAGFPILRHGVLASFPLAPVNLHKTFMIDFTTFAIGLVQGHHLVLMLLWAMQKMT